MTNNLLNSLRITPERYASEPGNQMAVLFKILSSGKPVNPDSDNYFLNLSATTRSLVPAVYL